MAKSFSLLPARGPSASQSKNGAGHVAGCLCADAGRRPLFAPSAAGYASMNQPIRLIRLIYFLRIYRSPSVWLERPASLLIFLAGPPAGALPQRLIDRQQLRKL